MPVKQLDKVLFLTAKTPGRKLALDSLQVLYPRANDAPLRVLELVARDRACEYPAKPVMAMPARWPKVFTTVCPQRDRRRLHNPRWINRHCARSPSHIRCARIT